MSHTLWDQGAELVDRASVALSDLSFPRGPKLAVGEERAHQQDHPAKTLQQGGADLVLCLQPLKGSVMHEPWLSVVIQGKAAQRCDLRCLRLIGNVAGSACHP